MQDKYIQSIRYKLQKRVRRLNSINYRIFPMELRKFFAFMESVPILTDVKDELMASVAEASLTTLVDAILSDGREPLMGNTEREHAALSYRLLKAIEGHHADFSPFDLGHRYGATGDQHASMDRVREVFLEPFYEYVDEHIDDQQAILYFLRKYKHRSEWFHRKRLNAIASADTQKCESSLAFDMYEYLHDQGIDFSIEPKSASGRADLITEQVGQDRVVADAKVFRPDRSKGKGYIVSGFNQVYTYLRDYNQPFGYLVVFKMCEDDIKFMVPSTTAMFPSLSHNNKTIFFVVVDICEYESTASKRGQLKVHEITADDLIRSADTVALQQGPGGEVGEHQNPLEDSHR